MSSPRRRHSASALPGKVDAPPGHEGDKPEVLAHEAEGGMRERFEAAVGWVREGGHTFEWMDRMLFWWKQLGLKRGLTVFTLFILPVVNAEWTARLGEGLVDAAAEHYGVEARVGHWSGAWLGLHANAHDVVVTVRGPFTKNELFRAATVSVDLSLISRIRFGHWIKSVEIERPSIHVERALSGRWNWEDVIGVNETDPAATPHSQAGALKVSEPVAATATAGPVSPVLIEHLEMKDLRIEWVEHLPGNSGGGLIQSTTATLYVDDVHLLVDRFGAADGVTPFSFDGRTADGRVAITGSIPAAGPTSGLRTSIYLENVGAAAVGHLTPNARLVPASGSVTGRVELIVHHDGIDCQTNVVLRNVTYVVNPYAPLVALGQQQALRERLAAFVVNGPAQAACTGKAGDKEYRLATAVQTSVTNQAVQHAAPEIKAAAAADFVQSRGRLTDAAVTAGVDVFTRAIANKAGVSAPTNPADASNPVAKGVKSMGSGLKRLFGGGKPKKKGSQ